MLNILAGVLMVAALVLLAACVPPLRRLVGHLPVGPLRLRWRMLGGLLLVQIAGCLVYLALLLMAEPGTPRGWGVLVAPALLSWSALFMWQVCHLSHGTIENVRRISTLDRAQVTDALTGLRSRHYLDNLMQRELLRADRRGIAVSVMLLDIDHFAGVNRTYGHAVGDQVLTEIGHILGASVRESDVLVRYGGEEIAILAPHTPPAAAVAVAERLRREIEVGARKALREAQGARQAITVSIGVSGREARAGLGQAQDLFALAEQALRKAKREGRNRVEYAGAAPAPSGQ